MNELGPLHETQYSIGTRLNYTLGKHFHRPNPAQPKLDYRRAENVVIFVIYSAFFIEGLIPPDDSCLPLCFFSPFPC